MLDFSEEIQMFENGILPRSTLIAYFLKKMATEGTQNDFNAIPEWIKDEIAAGVKQYKHSSKWQIVSNNDVEDLGSYAANYDKTFLK